MLRRRSFLSRNALNPTLLNSLRWIIPEDPVELEREKELRQKVMQRYRGMQLPGIVNPQYGHFASEGGATSAAASQAFTAASGGSFTGNASNKQGGVDWFMLLTGIALVYFSSKLMLKRFLSGDLDGVSLPLWTASVETQAKYLLFYIQFDAKAREGIKIDYHRVRQEYPFTDFFQWLRSRHPEFGNGMTYTYDTAVGTLVKALSSSNSQSLMTLARGVQNAIRNQQTPPPQRIDTFLLSLGTMGDVMKSTENGFTGVGYAQFHQQLDHAKVYGTEQVSLQNALDASPTEQHSSVPFEQR